MAKHSFNKEDNILTYTFSGKLDTKYSMDHDEKMHNALKDYESNKPFVVFDFKEVDFVSSSFIRICMVFVKNVGKEKFSINNTNPMIKKTFKIAGLEELLEVK